MNAKALTTSIEMRDRAKKVAALLSTGRDVEASLELSVVRRMADRLSEELRVRQPWPDPDFKPQHST